MKKFTKSVLLPFLAALLVFFFLLNKICSARDEYFLPGDKIVVFLGANEGYSYVAGCDFLKRLTRTDLFLRMEVDLEGKDLGRCREEYLAFHHKQFRNWSAVDQRYVMKQLTRAYEKIGVLTPAVLPDTLFLIRTTGRQEFNSFYTCGKSIVCPSTIRTSSTYLPMFRYIRNYMERVFIHELFHIYSSCHPEQREELYRMIGFERIDSLNMDPDIAGRLITNPDDKSIRYRIRLTDGQTGEETDYCLLILSKYDGWKGYIDFPARLNVLLVYLESGLVPIRQKESGWQSVHDPSDRSIVKRINDFPGFPEKTGWPEEPLSPEEIVAHMFVDLVTSEGGLLPVEGKPERYGTLLNRMKSTMNKERYELDME